MLTAKIAARVVAANVVVAVTVYLYLVLVSPSGTSSEESWALEMAIFGLYVVVGAIVGWRVGVRRSRPVSEWLDQGRSPSAYEVEETLKQPMRHAQWVFQVWCGGAVLFAGIHVIPGNPIHYDPDYGLMIGAVVVLGGLSAAMLSYLLIDESLRPIFAHALSESLPARPHTLGVRQRIITSWAFGSGVALIAIGLAPIGSPRVILAVWFLVPVGLVAGGLMVAVAAGSVARPIADMRHALAQIEEGNFNARVEVNDGSEVGLLQAGFNRMATGLMEREQLREIFGTYVDPEIAEHILHEGTSLTGEEVEVTIMFLDIRDFTGFSERAPAQEVVTTINRLFELAVPTIHEHQGHVDKFVGDGVLAVFGAPRRQRDHADQALQAAIEIAGQVREEFRGALEVGIGLNSGKVVAGNVGGGGRFEFSVIGDAVNVAARIEAATRQTGDTVLISERTKELLRGTVVTLTGRANIALKGKAEPVRLFAPELSDTSAGNR